MAEITPKESDVHPLVGLPALQKSRKLRMSIESQVMAQTTYKTLMRKRAECSSYLRSLSLPESIQK
ncbi:MAG: hypothetical protein VX683_00610, partial [Cyanobacteriota bacterium]|nr:hypothetical protein [Cyanobacteriota bacterium]